MPKSLEALAQSLNLTERRVQHSSMKVILHSQIHEWHERDEDGVMHIFRASWNSREWMFEVTTKKDPDWHEVAVPTLEMLEALRDVLWRKYQRSRLPWRFVEDLDAKILKMKGGESAAE